MIRPVSVVTTNVAKELQRIKSQNPSYHGNLFVDINSVQTFYKKEGSDFIEMKEEEYDKFSEEEVLRDPTLELKQEYDVLIQAEHEHYTFKDLIFEIKFEKHNTEAYLVIKKGSVLAYTPDLYDEFMEFITQQKIIHGIILYLFDVEYEKTIKGFVDVIAQVKKITFKDDKSILISQGVHEIKSVRAEVHMTLEEESTAGKEDQYGRIDYSDRGFLLSCNEGQELFEFCKPKQGKHGRTCKGEIIEVETVDLDAKPMFTTNDNIEVVDSFENIKYLSTKSGYLIKDGESYDVSNSVDVDEISFKTTGTINTDLKSEIIINVIKDDPLEDAVEEGMHVKVQQLHITGSIGRYTQIEARDISISGQTHNESEIKCSHADINIHKGKLIGRTVEIKNLDGGFVCADKVIITNATSGTVKAKVIEVEVLGSHVILEASESIEIEKIKGDENRFIMDSTISCGFDNKKSDDEEYQKKISKLLEQLMYKQKEVFEKIKKNQGNCEQIKAAIIKAKDQGIKISSALTEKFKLCKLMKIQYKKIKEEIAHKSDQLDKVNKKMLGAGNIDILESKIVVNQPMNGYNQIIYRLQKPKTEIELNIDHTMRKKIFKLIQDEDDGFYKIINMD